MNTDNTYQELLHFIINNSPETIASNWSRDIDKLKRCQKDHQEFVNKLYDNMFGSNG